MADTTKAMDTIAAWITFDNDEEAVVSVQDVIEYIGESGRGLLGSEVLEVTPIVGGLVRLDVHLEAIDSGTDFEFDSDTGIPLLIGGGIDATLRASTPYYVLFERTEDGEPVGEPKDAAILSCEVDALRTTRPDSWLIEEGVLEYEGDRDKDLELDPSALVSFYSTVSDRRVTLFDLLGGLLVMRASVGVATQMRERREAGEHVPEAVPLAQYAKAEIFQNHDLSSKAVDGLFNIAMGAQAYELAPRSGKSKERYTLTASEDACTKLFGVRGANAEQVRAILGTVHSLIKDPRAAEFAHEGRVWFTVNRIAEELLRTDAGTIHAKDNRTAHELVDAALEAASGAQIKGTSPDGTTTKVFYLLDAVRLDEATYNGETYRDVWGIAVSAETLAEYAEAKGHAYRYALPNRAQPFTLDTVAINLYLSDAMHEARGRLYTVSKTGKVSRRRGTNTVVLKRSWQGGERSIFDLFSPTHTLSSRQKDKLVRGFEDELTNIVREEAHGERHEGMPLYVRAWSERDGGRGRGLGAYRNLCIEVSTTFRAVRDGENGHGSINLREGKEKAAPDNAPK